MNYQTHPTIHEILKLENIQTWDGSGEFPAFRVCWPQTDAPTASGRWIMHSESIAMAFVARNPHLPWMMWYWTVTIQPSTCSILHKQLEKMIRGSECKKNFQVSSTIDEDWWIWSLDCSWRNGWMWEVLRSNLGKCDFCYD
jgi:hypothetical protein